MKHARRYVAPMLSLLLWFLPGPVLALDTTQDTNFEQAFRTEARFMIAGKVHQTVSALAWIERHPAWGAAGYYWLRIGFYQFHLTKQQIREAKAGSYRRIREKVRADYRSVNYKSHVQVILNIDKDGRVSHVDMAVPGHTCVIAPFKPEAEKFLQDYVFEGGRLRLKSSGSFVCNFLDSDVMFQWQFDVDLPVFKFSDRKIQ